MTKTIVVPATTPRRCIAFVTFIALLFLFVVTGCSEQPPDQPPQLPQNRVDDWKYGGILSEVSSMPSSLGKRMMAASAPTAESSIGDSSIGFSVGGAKDINNFRENIKNNYFPITTDITYEGLFYDYYFDTGQQETCAELFCPSYSYAQSSDPIIQSGEYAREYAPDYYLTVGLNSGITDFQRKKLNLVIVLDISGSMGSPFSSYYYDQFTKPEDLTPKEKEEEKKSKMTIANEAVAALLDHLQPGDQFGMVVFELDGAYLAKPLSPVAATDMESIKDHVLDLKPQGGTNMEAGMTLGTKLFDDVDLGNPDEYETRIIFITDAMPNTGVTDEEGLFGMFKKNAKNGIYTTFIGVGVDLNTELVEHLTKLRGANYYSIHSAKDFKERMDAGFEYMVTPLVFGLELSLDAEGYDIEKVYGSPEANEATGEIMKVNTLFPSPKEDGETKGGVVLLKLKKTAKNGRLVLRVTYEDRLGKTYQNEKEIRIQEKNQNYYQNTGIRKAILLSRYADLTKSWIADERPEEDKTIKNIHLPIPIITRESGIVPCTFESRCLPSDIELIELGRWERPSVPLSVSNHYQGLFAEFMEYAEAEMNAVDDQTLQQEVAILEKLTSVSIVSLY